MSRRPATSIAAVPTTPTTRDGATCPRCGRPDLKPRQDLRCGECELFFIKTRPRGVAPLVLIFTLTLIIGAWALGHSLDGRNVWYQGYGGWGHSWIYIGLTIVALGIGRFADLLLHREYRRRFLGEGV